ncbi:hypothetical protein VitviT2T_001410 [Vitis vinifera]|uniref:AAA+ ATPase At3g28540-like C-terminal domain-containing protein n=1 Tax=Vitis vinifera TaxID=29760 RepID=A0ABY9BGA1_VITVI|nr:hypothetical protein VitviT2T_001410 [Vitis vinifera]
MSYCTPSGFKILAANYLNINSHPLYTKIEELMIEVEVTQQRLQKSSRNAKKSMLLLKELSNSWKGRRCRGSKETRWVLKKMKKTIRAKGRH